VAPLVVWTLLTIVLADGGAIPLARNYPTLEACEDAQAAAHDAAQRAIGVLDVGTLCVESRFDPLIKPRA
jgi:hypothetical protein